MSVEDSETKKNFDSFTAAWKTSLPTTIQDLDKHSGRFEQSYRRLTSLNAWRSGVLKDRVSNESLAFYAEAMNDALSSHVFARMGAWRSSLKALRSCVENVCYCLYYSDHHVELQLWELGKHRLSFSELINYFEGHPQFLDIQDEQLIGLGILKKEFGTLSRAVHGSAKNFRMIQGDLSYSLWKSDTASLGQWESREKAAIKGINILLLAFFREELTGTKNSGIRKALGNLFTNPLKGKIKSNFNVSI